MMRSQECRQSSLVSLSAGSEELDIGFRAVDHFTDHLSSAVAERIDTVTICQSHVSICKSLQNFWMCSQAVIIL